MPAQHESGFTLLELMVTIAVAAILVTIAVPSFRALVDSTRMATATNQFLAAIHLARSEAIRRGEPVSICATNDGSSCTGSDDYNAGWMVLSGQNPGAASTIMRVFQPNTSGIHIDYRFGATAGNHLTFMPTGAARTENGGMIMGSVRFCREDQDQRIIVNSTGRPRVSEEACES